MAVFEEPETGRRETDESQDANGGGNGKALAIIAGITLPVSYLVWHIGSRDMALTTGCCLAMILVAVGVCWDLKRHSWFWGMIALVSALHVPLILLVHWPHYRFPLIALAPIGAVDVVFIVGLVRFVQKHVMKNVPPDGEQ